MSTCPLTTPLMVNGVPVCRACGAPWQHDETCQRGTAVPDCACCASTGLSPIAHHTPHVTRYVTYDPYLGFAIWKDKPYFGNARVWTSTKGAEMAGTFNLAGMSFFMRTFFPDWKPDPKSHECRVFRLPMPEVSEVRD